MLCVALLSTSVRAVRVTVTLLFDAPCFSVNFSDAMARSRSISSVVTDEHWNYVHRIGEAVEQSAKA